MTSKPAAPATPPVTRSLAVFLAVLGVYLALPTRAYYWDGIGAALDIENAARGVAPLFVHPNHLAYQPLGFVLHVLSGVRALAILQALNCILGAATAALIYRLTRSLAWTGVFAFAATWWKFATDADAYIPAVFFVVAAYAAACRGRAAAAGALHAAAMLFHQLALPAAPALALLLWRYKRRSAAIYAALAAAPVGAAYVWAYYFRAWEPPAPFLGWVASHSTDSAFAFDPVHGVALSLRGTLRLFFGGKLSPEAAQTWPFVAAGLALAGLFAGLIYSLRNARRPDWRKAGDAPLLLWLAVYAVFLVFWLPHNTFYRVFYLPPLVMLAARIWPAAAQARLAAAVLFVWNLVFFIAPHARVENNRPLAFALEQRAKWKPGTLVIHGFPHNDLRTIAYFNPQTRWVWARYWNGEMAPETWVESAAADKVDVDRSQQAGYPGVVFFKARAPHASRE